MFNKNRILHIGKTYFSKDLVLLLLLPVFFLLHGYNENFGLIPVPVLANLFFVYLIVSGSLVLISVLLLQKPHKAFVFSFYLLTVYFFFGAFHDLLKSVAPDYVFSSYKVVLPFLFILTGLVFILIKKAKRPLVKLVRYLVFLLIVLCFLELITLIYYFVQDSANRNDLSQKPGTWQGKKDCLSATKPDIFFVVLDGYTSSPCLKSEFNFDNYEIDSLLQANRFFVSAASGSNYNVTPFSLTSTMEGNYLRPGLEKDIVSSRVFLQAMESFANNQLVNFLSEEGYAIKNYGCFDLKNAPAKIAPYFKNLYRDQIDNQTLYARSMRDIGWNFQLKNIFTGKIRIPDNYKRNKAYHLYRNRYNWDGLLRELQTKAEGPRFVYVHLMLPHGPYYLDANGKEVSDTIVAFDKIEPKAGYLEQVKFCNRLLKEMIPKAAQGGNRERVMIIEGDHGFRNYRREEERSKIFLNLNAIYFSDGDYRGHYNGISPVNTFRVVMNKYFCQSNPLLKDSSIYLINNIY